MMTRKQYFRKRPDHRWPVSVIWLLILGFVLLYSGTALGQGRPEVQAQLERTDELIENARELISEAGSVSGHTVLEQAVRHQKYAWQSFNRGRWGQALKLTERARDELYRALGNIRPGVNNEGEVERQLERTDIVLEEARDRIGSRTAPVARRALDMATTTQRRAWDLYRERNLRPALRLTLEARQMILRRTGDASNALGNRQLDDATYTTRYEQLQQALERVEGRIGDDGNSQAQQHIETARRLLHNARDSYANGERERTDRLLNDARRELERAMREVVADVRADEITVLIETAEDRLDLLRSPVLESGDTQVQTWFDQASESLALARDALKDGRNQRALFHTRNAADLVNRIADEVQP